MQDNKRCCGTCEFNYLYNGEFTCSNPDSDNCGLPTAYDDKCFDYEEKEK